MVETNTNGIGSAKSNSKWRSLLACSVLILLTAAAAFFAGIEWDNRSGEPERLSTEDAFKTISQLRDYTRAISVEHASLGEYRDRQVDNIIGALWPTRTEVTITITKIEDGRISQGTIVIRNSFRGRPLIYQYETDLISFGFS